MHCHATRAQDAHVHTGINIMIMLKLFGSFVQYNGTMLIAICINNISQQSFHNTVVDRHSGVLHNKRE